MEKKTVAEASSAKRLDAILQEVLAVLDAEDGKSFDEKKAAAIEILSIAQHAKAADTVIADILAVRMMDEKNGLSIKNRFWQLGEEISANSQIVLRKVIEADREGFLALQREYSAFRGMLKEESYCDLIWNEHTEDRAITFSITHNGDYVGYCAVPNTTCEPWEISIELLPEWTNRGIGRLAITTMLNEIKARLGVQSFKARIEPTNYASQKLIEKLGAVPNGIAELWIHDQKTLEDCEEEHLHQIDDQLTAVAHKFGVEPRKLLSHVLEYTLSW